MKKIFVFLVLILSTSSCTIDDNYCDCVRKTYEVTEYQGEIIEQQQTGYRDFNGNCQDDGNGYYINNITWDGPYKHYTLTETYCY